MPMHRTYFEVDTTVWRSTKHFRARTFFHKLKASRQLSVSVKHPASVHQNFGHCPQAPFIGTNEQHPTGYVFRDTKQEDGFPQVAYLHSVKSLESSKTFNVLRSRKQSSLPARIVQHPHTKSSAKRARDDERRRQGRALTNQHSTGPGGLIEFRDGFGVDNSRKRQNRKRKVMLGLDPAPVSHSPAIAFDVVKLEARRNSKFWIREYWTRLYSTISFTGKDLTRPLKLLSDTIYGSIAESKRKIYMRYSDGIIQHSYHPILLGWCASAVEYPHPFLTFSLHLSIQITMTDQVAQRSVVAEEPKATTPPDPARKSRSHLESEQDPVSPQIDEDHAPSKVEDEGGQEAKSTGKKLVKGCSTRCDWVVLPGAGFLLLDAMRIDFVRYGLQ
ncbi:hypothetical protein R3P38DRAFT_2767875 [Favolaschia claudopus]|uniref:Uncharacterized protein n=1 Tax=Favolaschia claudopus TaxID=2862362 RepID=A0AAW0CQB6_9AGAR